jgi:FlaA1/EpsC-like NDP-sugar epimerase
LVLGAAAMAAGGEVFVLDMGIQVRILDLAKNLIKLSGLTPGRDIEIVYTGVRPGEKLAEELFVGHESTQRTPYERILVATDGHVYDLGALQQLLHDLLELSRDALDETANERLRDLLLAICHRPGDYLPDLPATARAERSLLEQRSFPRTAVMPATLS